MGPDDPLDPPQDVGGGMKDKAGDDRTKSEIRIDSACLQAAKYGGTYEDYLGERHAGSQGYKHGEAPGKVVAEYIYKDQNGEPYLKVERCENKQFPQYHWNPGIPGKKHGHW